MKKLLRVIARRLEDLEGEPGFTIRITNLVLALGMLTALLLVAWALTT